MWTVIFNDKTKYHGTDEVKAKGIYKLIRSSNYGKINYRLELLHNGQLYAISGWRK